MNDIVNIQTSSDGNCIKDSSMRSLTGKTFCGQVRIQNMRDIVNVTLVKCQPAGHKEPLWADTTTGQLYNPNTLQCIGTTRLRLIHEPTECVIKIKRKKRYD